MEEYTPETEKSKAGELKRWFQDNLRIVISVAIVIVIAGGIYSYSKRGETSVSDTQTAGEETAKADENKVAANSKEVAAVTASKETETSFVITAGKGAGTTVLARKAVADYLEKNQDSTLTKEHKIYIEDYLRKNVKHSGTVRVGTSVEFSKELIQKAVEKSKTLNARQLKNLEKYSARVSNL